MKKSRAAVRTINILELIAKESKGLTLSEIAAKLEIPITSVSDIIKALLDEEMIELIDERSKLYGIGVKAFYIGNAFIVNTTLVDKSKAIMEELTNKTGKTAFLGKEVNGKITYIYKCEPDNPLVATCDIGSRTNLHCTSLGKSFLAYDKKLMESLKHIDLIQKTPWTITRYEELEKEIRLVRKQGYATDDREQNDHLFCIGAPVFNDQKKVIAAVSVSGLYRDGIDVEKEGNQVKEAAREISRRLGFTS